MTQLELPIEVITVEDWEAETTVEEYELPIRLSS